MLLAISLQQHEQSRICSAWVTVGGWLQVPAGLIDQGEDAAQAAVRELKEETGLQQLESCIKIMTLP